jgi:hypothetical protein
MIVTVLSDEVRRNWIAEQGGHVGGEARLLRPLLRWLWESRRINEGTHLSLEFAWYGRRVDLATLTRTRRTTAYELKIGGVGRALEQASYNRLAFDRSYIVSDSFPRRENRDLAAEFGIGLIVVRGDVIRKVLESPVQGVSKSVRSRLLSELRSAPSINNV